MTRYRQELFIIIQKLKAVLKNMESEVDSSALVEWFSKEQVMEYLRISRSTYYKWLKEGILKPSSTIGEHRFLASDILEIVKGRKFRERHKY